MKKINTNQGKTSIFVQNWFLTKFNFHKIFKLAFYMYGSFKNIFTFGVIYFSSLSFFQLF